MSSKRLEVLLRMTAGPNADSFAWYALALEYRTLGRIDEALSTFAELRRRDAEYVPMYLMCGTMLTESGRREQAKEWLSAGLDAAHKKGDTHAAGEIASALDIAGRAG
jgi:tetratricopeptide (TPR) repeat protein